MKKLFVIGRILYFEIFLNVASAISTVVGEISLDLQSFHIVITIVRNF